MIKPRNILIVRTDRIGDVVLSLPLAARIKKEYPGSRITFLIREYTEPLTRENPDIDEIVILKMSDKKVLFRENVKILRSLKFDTAIMVYPTFLLSLIIYFSNIKFRIGTGYRWYSFLFNRKVYEHRKYAEKHELEYNFALLSEIGINEFPEPGRIKFHIPSDEQARKITNEKLLNNNLTASEKIIILHPGSGGSAVNLPLVKFRELAGMILTDTDSRMVITGSKEEKDLCEQLVISDRILNFAGEFNLSELIELIRRSSIFISNSTGPLHIAAALDKYVIGFYPKVKACSSQRWGPYSQKGYVFTPELDCRDCTVEQCVKLDCMSYINLNKVFEKIQKILKLLPNTGETDAI